MINSIIGFLGSYLEGLDPSRIPPCGAALTVDVADAEATVFVTTLVTMEVIVAISKSITGLEYPDDALGSIKRLAQARRLWNTKTAHEIYIG